MAQRRWPVIAKIDRDGAALGGRLGTDLVERVGLEGDDFWLVDLENHGARGPRQSIGPRVEPGGQDDGLPDSGRGGRAEEVVENLVRTVICSRRCCRVIGMSSVSSGIWPSSMRVKKVPDGLHQRLGELVIEQWVGLAGRHRPGGRHHGRGRAHARFQVPAVALGSRRIS